MPGVALGSMALHALLQCNVEEVVVVVHPNDPLDWLPNELEGRIRVKRSDRADDGMAYSLRAGLNELRNRSDERLEPDAILVLLADQPFVNRVHIDRLLNRFRQEPSLDYVASIVTSESDGNRALMPPAVLSRTMYTAIGELKGDAGARKLFSDSRFHGDVLSAVSSEILLDVDNPIDFELAIKLFRTFRS